MPSNGPEQHATTQSKRWQRTQPDSLPGVSVSPRQTSKSNPSTFGTSLAHQFPDCVRIISFMTYILPPPPDISKNFDHWPSNTFHHAVTPSKRTRRRHWLRKLCSHLSSLIHLLYTMFGKPKCELPVPYAYGTHTIHSKHWLRSSPWRLYHPFERW